MAGSLITYSRGMELDEEQQELWNSYTEENREKCFWLFLNTFVDNWEKQVIPTWELLVTSRLAGGKEVGPPLERLPEELLPALGKFLYIGRDAAEQGAINREGMEQMRLILKCLTVLCLHTHNIPLIASIDLVKQVTQLNTLLLQHLLEMESAFYSSRIKGEAKGQNLRTAIVDFILESCHFLETLYDPHFRWRAYLCGKDTPGLPVVESPISLHPETVPFIYESFETALVDCFPRLAHEMLTVLGALISGARHNATKAISPATSKMLLKTVRDSATSQEIHINAIYVSSLSIALLHQTPLEERQVELGLLLDQFQQILLSLAGKEEACLATLIEGVSLLTRTLQVDRPAELQEQFARSGLLTTLMRVVEECCLPSAQKRILLPVVIARVSLMLRGCAFAQGLMEKEEGHTRLFSVVSNCGPTDYSTLHAILALATYGEDPTTGAQIRNIEPIKKLLMWLTETEYENHDQQVWLTEALLNLCRASVQNKQLCCQSGVVITAVGTLRCHRRLQALSAEFLLRLVETLCQHSLGAEELKLLLQLLQPQQEGTFPYRSHVTHIISTIAKGDGYEHCRHYFDIHEATDGITVPSIGQWAGPVLGFTFHSWLRLDPSPPGAAGLARRQLYTFYTASGSGLEAFCQVDGTLVVAVAYKKEFLAVKVEGGGLADGQWHSVTVSQAAAKRPFGASQLTVYIDGREQKSCSLKYPVFTEPLAYCTLGAPLVRPAQPSLGVEAGSKLSLRDNIKDAIKSSVPGVWALPQYLKPTSTDPGVAWTMVGMEDVMWGNAIPLRGQLGLLHVFDDSVTASQVSMLHSAGSNKVLSTEGEVEAVEVAEVLAKLVFTYSARVCSSLVVTNLAPGLGDQYEGHTLASPNITRDARDVINCLGGVQVLFPLLEAGLSRPDSGLEMMGPGEAGAGGEAGEWELLPSSSFSDWKLEKNPVSGFLTLIKNLITNHQVNQEQLMRGGGIAIIGSLLQSVESSLIDVNVLMASQLFVELATASHQTKMLGQFHTSILFDFRIWARSEFHLQIGHIQYLATLIMADRKYFRKKFGVQFQLDVIRQHYTDTSSSLLSKDDNKTIRAALFGLIKFFLQKEVNAKEVSALTSFTFLFRKTNILDEVVDLVLGHLESRSARDQMFLLLLEPRLMDLSYCILLDEAVQGETRAKIYHLLLALMKTPKVSSRHKTRLHLQECGYIGWLYMRAAKEPSLEWEEVSLLTGQMLGFEMQPSSYAGLLSLCHHLQLASLETKLEVARRLLTLIYSHPHAAGMLARQMGWQGCIARLLVKEVVIPEMDTMVSVDDVISLADDDDEEVGPETENVSPSHYINRVTDTARQFLPEQASATVDRVAGEASKVLSGTSRRLKTSMGSAGERLGSTVHKTGNMVSGTVFRAAGLLETVGDLAHGGRRARGSMLSLDSELLGRDGNPECLQQFEFEGTAISEGGVSPAASSEDMSKSRDTVCSSPTHTHNSISEDEISFDMEHFNQELDAMGQAGSTEEGREDELVGLVTNILFAVLWRGRNAAAKHRKDVAANMVASQGQAIAAINMLALNNKLYASHAVLKRRLTELALQAIIAELKERKNNEQARLARHIMESAYDLVVLDEHEDFSKKVSESLLDGILGILDRFVVFQEGQSESEWVEMAKMAFDILLTCAESTKDLEFCAIATAKLHSLVQTRQESSTEETGFLIYRVDKIIKEALSTDNTDHYAFLVPIMKALLDKGKTGLEVSLNLTSLNLRQSGCEFFGHWQDYCRGEEWEYFISHKVAPLHNSYNVGFLGGLRDQTNVFWAECYEEAKVAQHRRNREIGESKLAFHSLYMEPFKQRLRDESGRFHNILTQQKSNQVFVQKRWRIMKRLFFGPRGAWHRSGETLDDHWMMGTNENIQRMRMKLVPNQNFDNHEEASAQRDNVKRPVKEESQLMTHQIALEAVNTDFEDEMVDLTEEDLKSIAKEQMSNSENTEVDLVDQEKFVMSEECELVTMMSVVKGRFELTNNFLYFFDTRPCTEEEERYDNRWSLSTIREVHLRRFNLRRSALEIFIIDHTNFFLNFASSKRRNKVFTKVLSQRPPNMVSCSGRSPSDLLRTLGVTQKWINRDISNFEYLMQLNTIAGRSYNDLSQYPVFPWVLADYTSPTLDLGNSDTFRDLSKPIGAQNSKHVEEIKQKYDNFEDPSGAVAKFHYGTHYSNSAMVLHYLVRVEPFTSLHIQLQSGRFDVADRQFHSIPQAWKSLMSNINDVKELIPEFYFSPDFLLNQNNFDLGRLQGQKKQLVNDVVLPPWATSVDDFVRQHRRALESEYVSAHLHEWIDLIFGYKQKGKDAEEAMNVFYYCCYEGAVNLDAITDPAEREALEGMIQNFGQVPCQLLREPHPTRMSYSDHRARLLKQDYQRPDVLAHPTHWRPYCVQLGTERSPVVFLQHPAAQTKGLLQYGTADSLVTVSMDATIGHHAWLPYDRNTPNYFYFERDVTMAEGSKTRRRLPGPFARGLVLKSQAFAVTGDARHILYGGSWDCSLRTYSLARGKEVMSAIRHTEPITCLALDRGGLCCITGSYDTTAIVWELSTGRAQEATLTPRATQVLHGHELHVTSVAVSVCLDVALSGSKDGTVNMHTVRDGQYLRTLRPSTHEPTFTVEQLTLSYQGHVIFTGHDKASHSLHVFTLNGRHLSSVTTSHRVTGLIASADRLLAGDENGDLVLRDLYTMEELTTLPLQLPIQTLALTEGNTHILAPLRDGKVIVVGLAGIPENNFH